MGANDGKRNRSVDAIETFAYWANEEIIHKKEEIKFNNIIKQYKND